MGKGGDKKEPSALLKLYLCLYNLTNVAGWAFVLFTVFHSFFVAKLTPAAAYDKFGPTLLFVQSLAAMEIVHAFLRWVPSPVGSTFMQVFSRYAVMWAFTYVFPQCQSHWSVYLMVGSWSLVEVPRYLFYAVNLYTECPFPLFWLRYSLFAILYPSGISGEILQIVTAMPVLLQHGMIPQWYLCVFLLSLYLPGSPFMFFHMVHQRKSSLKKRAEKLALGGAKPAAPPSEGVDFPVDPATGQRSTTLVNQGAIVASITGIDQEAADKAKNEKNWRFGYAKHVVKNVELSCKSNKQCLKIAEQGLDYLHKNFVFVQPKVDKDDKSSISVMEAMEKLAGVEAFADTYEIKGEKTRDSKFEYCVPYQKFLNKEVKDLKGEELLKQLDLWVKKGSIEQDARDAVANMITQPEYHGKSLEDKWFVLLGAGSAMGPLRVLLELGCNVIAIDIDRDFVWKRLIDLAKNSPGRMVFPIKKKKSEIKDDEDLAKNAGADLLKQAPQIATWITKQMPGKQLILGGYAYLDSALFVRLAIAMDAIMAKVIEKRKNAALAFLCSPTDVFVTDNECHDAQVKSAKSVPLWQSILKMLVPKNMLVKNAIPQVQSEDGSSSFSIVDGLAVAQGPNYALAKRLQHWRCMLAREAGHTVSTNIAPSTATQSVVHNPQFAAAYVGMGFFKPMEIVYQDLSNSVMTALLLNDVCNPHSAANANTKLGNQIRLFSKTSMHFGIWRMAFKCGSIGEVSAMIGYCKMYANVLFMLAAASVAFCGVLVQKGAPHKWFQ